MDHFSGIVCLFPRSLYSGSGSRYTDNPAACADNAAVLKGSIFMEYDNVFQLLYTLKTVYGCPFRKVGRDIPSRPSRYILTIHVPTR